MERFARALELTSAYVGIAMLFALMVATAPPPGSYAAVAASASNTACTAPAFYSFSVPPANLNTPWSLPLLSTIDGPYAPTVVAKGLPAGVTLQDQKVTLDAGGGTLHTWVLAGAPSQVGTYSITVTAQNTCGGTSAVISLPVGTAVTAQGQVCPTGTVGTYPNCSPVVATTSAATQAATAAPAPATSSTPTATTPPPTILPSANAAAAAQSAATGAVCIGTASSMSQGGSGGAVVALQQFLITGGYLAPGYATGYFGPLTRAAVEKYQLSAGVVASPNSLGYGVVGPKTRAAINAQCTSTVKQTQSRTGVICAQPIIPVCPGGSPVQIGVDENGCSRGYYCSTQHTCPAVSQPTSCGIGQAPAVSGYDQNGCVTGYSCQTVEYCSTPVITSCPAGQTLVSGTDQYGCPNVSYCNGTPTPTPTPAPTPSGTLTASPSSGQAPLTVTFSGMAPFGASIDYGDGTPLSIKGCGGAPCGSFSSPVSDSHTYNSTGTFTARLMFNGTSYGSATITVSNF